MKPFFDPITQKLNFPERWLTTDGNILLFPIRINLYGIAFAISSNLGFLVSFYIFKFFGLAVWSMVAAYVFVGIPTYLCLAFFSVQTMPMYADKRICDAGIAHILITAGLAVLLIELATYYWFTGRLALFGCAILLEAIVIATVASLVTEKRNSNPAAL